MDAPTEESRVKINTGRAAAGETLLGKAAADHESKVKFGGVQRGYPEPHETPAPARKLPKPRTYPWYTLSPRKKEILETGTIEIEASETEMKPQKFDWISVVFQPLGALLAIVVILIALYVTGVGMSMGLYMLIGGFTGVMGIVWGVLRYRSQKKQAEGEIEENKSKYHTYLESKRQEILHSTQVQLNKMNADTPSVERCVEMGRGSPTLWSRSIDSDDFLLLRLGTGSVDFYREIRVPEKRYSEENTLTDEAREMARKYKKIEDAPICCNLRTEQSLGIVGPRDAVTAQTMALLVEATALHSYEELKIVLIYPAAEASEWAVFRFLPHVYDNDREQRYLAENREQAIEILKSIAQIYERRRAERGEYGFVSGAVSQPHFLVVVADLNCLVGNSYGKMLCACEEEVGISCIFLANRMNQLPQQCKMITELDEREAVLYDKAKSNESQAYRAETVSEKRVKSFVSTIAPIRLKNPNVMKGIPRSVTFFEAYGVSGPEELNLSAWWECGHPERSMEVPLGVGKGGEQIRFDIHPNMCGAHGIFVGGTSSGKTTMVRAWVLSMAATFSPERVAFVLVDFKEPGLLTGLKSLPHVVGTIGKLDTDIERNLTALKSEISRRQKVFDIAGAINIFDYLEKHYAGESCAAAPVPFLYIVVDELNEFKMWSRDGAGSDWMHLLDQLYQTGSALGIHVIAGSQTPGPFSPVMFSNARFRWCLRTNEPSDSKEILGNTDAFDIKARGRAFICVGSDIEEVQPMYADSPYYTPEELREIPERSMALVSVTGARKRISEKKTRRASELEMTVRSISQFAERNHIAIPDRIWPERLPDMLLLDSLRAPERNKLAAVVGLVDDPAVQKQYPLEVDLTKTGCFLVYGAGQTGKTTFLRTFALSMLENNSPDMLTMYIIESAIGDFDGFEAFPHVKKVSNIYSAADVIKEINALLEKRRKQRMDKGAKRIVCLVDNLNGIIADYKGEILNVVQNGPGQGIYLIAAATQAGGAASIMAVENLVKTGYSFWISQNAYDYRGPIHCNEIKAVPPSDIPGRGIASIGRAVSFQTARIVPEESRDSLHETVRRRAVSRWGTGKHAVAAEEPDKEKGTAVLGYSADRTEIVRQDFRKSTSLLIFGDDHGRVQDAVREIAGQLAETMEEAIFVGVDLEADGWEPIPNMTLLKSGEALDSYLLEMREELAARGKDPGGAYRPYVFVFADFRKSIESSSRTGKNRIDKNLLLNARRYSISVVAGCTYSDFQQARRNEEERIAEPGDDEIVPLTRAAVGKCLLMDAKPEALDSFFQARYAFGGRGDYYLSAGKAEPIDRSERE